MELRYKTETKKSGFSIYKETPFQIFHKIAGNQPLNTFTVSTL
jgi:hypothetical protein